MCCPKRRNSSRRRGMPFSFASSYISFMYDRTFEASWPMAMLSLIRQNSSAVLPTAWMKPNSCMFPGESVPS